MVGSALQRRCELGSQKVTVPEGELASCRCRRRRRAISLGVVLSQFSDNTPPDANTIPHRTLKPTPVVCQPAPLEGGLTSGPTTETAAIEFASAEARQQNICNQPNSSTAKATFTTWDTAQKWYVSEVDLSLARYPMTIPRCGLWKYGDSSSHR